MGARKHASQVSRAFARIAHQAACPARGQYPRALQAVPDADAACMVIAPEKSGGDPLRLAHAILCAVWGQDRLDFLDRALAA